ncbi:MAG: hypothetical protein ACI95C_001618 [Pseudohongiellaceae bacterium]
MLALVSIPWLSLTGRARMTGLDDTDDERPTAGNAG